MNYIIIILFIAPLTWQIYTDYKQGVCWAVFLLTALSANPVLITGEILPNFNMQRLILIIVLLAAIRKNQLFRPDRSVPFLRILVIFATINLLPLILSIDLVMSIKTYLAFTIEIVLFYVIVSTSITTRHDARRIVLAGTSAILTVAIVAIIERYSGFNPVDSFMSGYVRKPEYKGDILSTFPHRILFGTAMAMGWPLALSMAKKGKPRQWIWWAGLCIILLACYFSFSRGPWIAAILGGIVIFLFAGPVVRRQTMVVTVLISVALVLRPGVWETITVSARDTANVDSFKGQTYQYRWELWGIAWNKISRSGERLLFGFGQGTTEVMTFSAELSYTGETTSLWSWDNHYAATLMESGLVGFVSFTGLYFLFFMKLLRARSVLLEEDITMHAAIIAAVTAMLFMMTNVAMFAPQLNYVLWSFIAAGLRLGMDDSREKRYGVAVAF